MTEMRFIDLFCGVGGFHHALHDLGHECVLAADIDKNCRYIYDLNWNKKKKIQILNDVKDVVGKELEYDILCAGWPCQPFSKSGKQMGFMDETRGTLFHTILEIIGEKEERKPKVVFLENVPNLMGHDGGNTIKVIKKSLRRLGYEPYICTLSPHQFGVPQHRPRVFIVAINTSKVKQWDKFDFPKPGEIKSLSIESIREKNPKSVKEPNEDFILATSLWTEFMEAIPAKLKPPAPTWGMEFGRQYPLEGIYPLEKQTKKQLRDLLSKDSSMPAIIPKSYTKSQLISMFPPYVRNLKGTIPEWKKKFILKNRKWWGENKKHLSEDWLKRLKGLQDTHQKLEWHVGNDRRRNLMNHMIHSRPSGLRVSKMNWMPALVAISQTPIIGPWGRYLTVREAANAQSFKHDFLLHEEESVAFKQMGNSVNVKVVKEIMRSIEKVIV